MAWTRLTADAVISERPARLLGLVLLVSATGGGVTVYNGVDATSGHRIARFEAVANESLPVMFPEPLVCDRGLFVDVGSNVAEVLILWEPG